MSLAGRIAAATAGVAGVAVAGGAVSAGVAVNRARKDLARRGNSDSTPFGSLHAPARTIVTTDGVPLHVEVDEPEAGHDSPVTLVFIHGYALNLDCWHFQRAAYRGLVRSVFYDQRSHGRSGRSPIGSASIDQLGTDLLDVLDAVVPEGPVVLVGHSMGGMTIVALAEQHPELFAPLAPNGSGEGGRIVGAALISTTAGGLDPSRMLFPMVPSRLGSSFGHSAVRALARGHRAVDGVRRIGRSLATVVTDAFAFGDRVPTAYVEFVDDMLSATPFEVVAEFFPSFRALDKFDAVGTLGRIPTTIVCGTADRLTSVGHSRKLHARIPGSSLVECEGSGHMVILERHEQVNVALDQLLAAATRISST